MSRLSSRCVNNGEPVLGVLGKDPCQCAGSGGPLGAGDRQGTAAHAFPGRDSPGSGSAGVGGRVEGCGRGNRVRAEGGDGFSAAVLSPLVFFLEVAGVELPVFGITALKTE